MALDDLNSQKKNSSSKNTFENIFLKTYPGKTLIDYQGPS